jgi:chaperonin GroES
VWLARCFPTRGTNHIFGGIQLIQPLANRVLIKPDPPPDETASGLIIPDNAHASKDFEMSGTVIAKGTGPASAHRVREAMIARFHKVVDDVVVDGWRDALLIRRQIHRELNEMAAINLSEIAVGDHVAFPYTAGTVLIVDGERHLLMNEDQIVAILEPARTDNEIAEEMHRKRSEEVRFTRMLSGWPEYQPDVAGRQV